MSARLSLIATAGLVTGAGAVWLAAHSSTSRPTEPGVTLTVVVGVSLFVSGLLSWRRRPDSRLGPVMVATGFAWFAKTLVEANTASLFTIGEAIQYLWIVGFICILVSFPSGRLNSLDRGIVAAAVVLAFAFQLAAMLCGDGTGLNCTDCPSNVMRVSTDDALAEHILDWQRILAGALALGVIALLVIRRQRASRPTRHAADPVLLVGVVALVALIGTIVNDQPIPYCSWASLRWSR
jgi:hypothetical protein